MGTHNAPHLVRALAACVAAALLARRGGHSPKAVESCPVIRPVHGLRSLLMAGVSSSGAVPGHARVRAAGALRRADALDDDVAAAIEAA